ncbi:hypothetical protein VNO78_15077 [Psophocarpus tetragonolobus]|uniref:Uncharacterized protein n=1 Tax=Psophocarpus tetragonolobus TaxID=3891 RepID=A0AAN9SDZ0_PSOTE
MTLSTRLQDNINSTMTDGKLFVIKMVEECGIHFWDQHDIKREEKEFTASNASSTEEEEVDPMLMEQRLGELRRVHNMNGAHMEGGYSCGWIGALRVAIFVLLCIHFNQTLRTKSIGLHWASLGRTGDTLSLHCAGTLDETKHLSRNRSQHVEAGTKELAAWSVWKGAKDLGVVGRDADEVYVNQLQQMELKDRKMGSKECDWKAKPSDGLSGGMLMIWKAGYWTVYFSLKEEDWNSVDELFLL